MVSDLDPCPEATRHLEKFHLTLIRKGYLSGRTSCLVLINEVAKTFAESVDTGRRCFFPLEAGDEKHL